MFSTPGGLGLAYYRKCEAGHPSSQKVSHSHNVRESGFRNQWNFCLWNPEISEIVLLVDSGILGHGIRNTAQGIRNPTDDWYPESKFHWQRRGKRYLESRIQNCLGYHHMGRFSCKWFARFCIKEMLEKALGSSGRRIRSPSIPVHICHPLKQMTGNTFIVLIFQTGPLLFRILLMWKLCFCFYKVGK